MKQNDFAESMLKGRMAETLFEGLMKDSGNKVYRFGYEAITQNLVQLGESFDKYGEVSEKIRAIPDFIVIDKKGKPQFVEVKFRWEPNEPLYDQSVGILNRVAKYWNAPVVFMNCWEQPFFRVSVPPYFDKNKRLIYKPITSISEWSIEQKIYNKYENLIHKYLTPTLVPPKK
ncbi:MAG: hypothetical protein AAB513_02015 [Patescibacteria group bacterium]